MSFVERVNQGESLASLINWLTEPHAVSWSVIMGDLSAIWKGEIWTHPNAFRTGPGSCAVHSMPFFSVVQSLIIFLQSTAIIQMYMLCRKLKEVWKVDVMGKYFTRFDNKIHFWWISWSIAMALDFIKPCAYQKYPFDVSDNNNFLYMWRKHSFWCICKVYCDISLLYEIAEKLFFFIWQKTFDKPL